MADDLPPPHPAFARHFSDPLYADLGSEEAPFGSDEGFDMLYDWVDRRDELGPGSTVVQLVEDAHGTDLIEALDVPESSRIPQPGGQVDAATIVVAAGFTLLRLTGRIDDAGKALTLRALDVLLSVSGGAPEFVRQRDDLLGWQN